MVKKAGELLKNFLSGDQFERAMKFDEFHRSWSDIAGQRLAAHSSVFDIDKGIMVVRADHPGWIQLLQLRQAHILKTVQTRFPELGIHGIAFRLVEGEGLPGGSSETGKAPISQSPDVSSEGQPSQDDSQTEETTRDAIRLDDIEDLHLREVLDRLRKSIADRNG